MQVIMISITFRNFMVL